MARELHDRRLECTAARALHCLSARYCFSNFTLRASSILTYPLYERAILPSAIHHCDG